MVGLQFAGFGLKDGFKFDGLGEMAAAHLASLHLDECRNLTMLPAELRQLVSDQP